MGTQKLRQAEGLLQIIHDPASGPVYVQLSEPRNQADPQSTKGWREERIDHFGTAL